MSKGPAKGAAGDDDKLAQLVRERLGLDAAEPAAGSEGAKGSTVLPCDEFEPGKTAGVCSVCGQGVVQHVVNADDDDRDPDAHQEWVDDDEDDDDDYDYDDDAS